MAEIALEQLLFDGGSKRKRVPARTEGRPAGARARRNEAEALRRRLSGAVEELIDRSSPAAVARALGAPGQLSSLGVLLDTFVQEHSQAARFDPEASARAQLLRARAELLKRAGGTCTTLEAAELLGTSADAVRKRLQRGTLLSYRTASGEHRLPMAQFDEGGVIAGLDRVLAAMHVEDDWMRVQLFLDDDVLGALREGRVEDAVRATRSFLPADEG